MEQPLYIVWKDEYNLGVNIIDEQHRGLISTINSFFYSIQEGDGIKVAKPAVRILNEYVKIHFDTEEALLKKMNYPDLDAHMAQHRQLMEKTNEIALKIKTEHDAWELMPFLKKWWIDHILEEDQKFIDLYRKNQQPKSSYRDWY
ncbi:hemerythrin family protein [Sansalvadorimonas sp. 2012CJ34-2]|uniref:Hemerythrin family protein n=1 Tax=Parendozoicomonas callyspongiae TaxID=2942213 RepID=A0ABT0PDL6_9GAMM|nr:hemerythrin family protein [Sansalvadorimonas sp. 2012CJ34-2]MCL6269459.1 hemerythrin family protein [Sansalvadorimonas sp. 2012CJ34-2]